MSGNCSSAACRFDRRRWPKRRARSGTSPLPPSVARQSSALASPALHSDSVPRPCCSIVLDGRLSLVSGLLVFRPVSCIAQTLSGVQASLGDFMKKALAPKLINVVRCPTCGAKPGRKCELNSGQPRTNPHRERRLTAADLRSAA